MHLVSLIFNFGCCFVNFICLELWSLERKISNMDDLKKSVLLLDLHGTPKGLCPSCLCMRGDRIVEVHLHVNVFEPSLNAKFIE
jgi:hypothetical protein